MSSKGETTPFTRVAAELTMPTREGIGLASAISSDPVVPRAAIVPTPVEVIDCPAPPFGTVKMAARFLPFGLSPAIYEVPRIGVRIYRDRFDAVNAGRDAGYYARWEVATKVCRKHKSLAGRV